MNHSKAASRENEPALCHVVYMVTYAIRSTRRCVTAETASQCKERSRKEYRSKANDREIRKIRWRTASTAVPESTRR